jgi:hypothetical protein
MTEGIWLRRLLPTAVAGMLFLVLSVLWLTGMRQPYEAFFWHLGIEPFTFPFLDTHAVLSAIECHRSGTDVYVTNPCDVLGRPHVYSPLWLYLSPLPIDTAWTTPIGLTLDLIFLASLVMLPPARHLIGTLIIAAAAATPAVAFALERANNDLVIFLLALLVCLLTSRSTGLRLLGIAFAVLAAALKFYPITLLILAWRERWLRCLSIVTFSLLVLGTGAFMERADLMRALQLLPHGEYGAYRMASGIVIKMRWPDWSRAMNQVGFMLVMAFAAWRWSRRLPPGLRCLNEMERIFLTAGAILCVGCFLAGPSNGYRSILFLFVLPPLIAVAAETDDFLLWATIFAVVAVMWSDAVRLVPDAFGVVVRLIDQSIWWFVITVLSAVLLALLRQSLAWTSLWEDVGLPADQPISSERRRRE